MQQGAASFNPFEPAMLSKDGDSFGDGLGDMLPLMLMSQQGGFANAQPYCWLTPSKRKPSCSSSATMIRDGATATAVGIRALRALGAQVDFLLPHPLQTRLRPLPCHRRSGRRTGTGPHHHG